MFTLNEPIKQSVAYECHAFICRFVSSENWHPKEWCLIYEKLFIRRTNSKGFCCHGDLECGWSKVLRQYALDLTVKMFGFFQTQLLSIIISKSKKYKFFAEFCYKILTNVINVYAIFDTQWFLPETSFGLRVLSLPLFVRPSPSLSAR